MCEQHMFTSSFVWLEQGRFPFHQKFRFEICRDEWYSIFQNFRKVDNIARFNQILENLLPGISIPFNFLPAISEIFALNGSNWPFSYYLKPLPQSESWCPSFHMKMRFHSHANLTHFHMNGCAPGLALIERLKATRKWAISKIQQFRIFRKQGSFFTACPHFESSETLGLIERAQVYVANSGLYSAWMQSPLCQFSHEAKTKPFPF